MAFKWRCVSCGCEIIMPYKSPETMSKYSAPMCPDCYEKALKEEKKNIINRIYLKEYKQDNGDPIFKTPEGMVFSCRKL